MAQAQLNDEALSWLLGEYEPAELVAWADGWIARLDSWPDELGELSLWGLHPETETGHLLNKLATGSNELDAVLLILEREYQRFRQQKDPFRLIDIIYTLTYNSLRDTAAYSELEAAAFNLHWLASEVYAFENIKDTREAFEQELIQEIHKQLGALPAPFTFKP